MPYSLYEPCQLSRWIRASSPLLIQSSKTPLDCPRSFRRACASTQYHFPTCVRSKIGVRLQAVASQRKRGKSLYSLPSTVPDTSVVVAGTIPRRSGSPDERPPDQTCAIAAWAQFVFTSTWARLSLFPPPPIHPIWY